MARTDRSTCDGREAKVMDLLPRCEVHKARLGVKNSAMVFQSDLVVLVCLRQVL